MSMYLGDTDDFTGGVNPHEVDGACPLCGGTLALTGDNLEQWIQCEQCNLESKHDAQGTAVEALEDREFENLADCPECGNTFGLKMVNERGSFSVRCSDGMCGCGISGPKAKDEMKALEKFNEIFG